MGPVSDPVNPDLAEAYRLMDPAELGLRLRDARTLAGRTQVQMAGDEITAAYISRIEAGQRKPEFHLLGRMAGRIDTTLEELLSAPRIDHRLEIQVTLDHAELNLAMGEASAALKVADQVLADLIDRRDRDFESKALRIHAFALEATGKLNEAISAFEDIAQNPERSPDWLRCLIALSRCYRETGEFDRAIGVGEQAHDAIVDLGLEGLTEAIQLTLTVAGAHMLKGDLDEAMRLCMRAAEAADQHDSPTGRASAYWNASIIESKRGSQRAALDLAQKALAYFEIGEDLRNLGRLRTQVAITQLRLDPPDAIGAIETLDKADREMSWAAVSTIDRASQALTRAQASFMLGNHDEALARLATCDELLPEDAFVMRASSLSIHAQVSMAHGDTKAARQQMLQAVQTLTAIGADREAAQLWFELGTMLEAVGETSAALDAFRRAAASTGVHGRPTVDSASAKTKTSAKTS